MSKVLISGLFIHPGKVGGAENYLYNLLKGFQRLGLNNQINLVLNAAYNNYHSIVNNFQPQFIKLKGNRAFYDYLLHYVIDHYNEYDTVFQPNYITPLQLFAPVRHPVCVTTIVDLLYLNFPQFFSTGKRTWQYLAHLNTLNRAKTVICISDFVRYDIMHRFGEKYSDVLKTIHLPIDFSRYDATVGAAKPYPFEYILSVSAMYPHKNTLTLLKAFREFKKTNRELKLVLAGQLPKNLLGSNFSDYHREVMDAMQNTPDIIVTGYVSDYELDVLYRHSFFFVYPSLFEGFGMPVVEALGAGKPTITTRCGSLQEVSMDKAIYLDNPTDPFELADKLNYCYTHLERFTEVANQQKSFFRDKYAVQNIASQYQKILFKE